MAKFPPAKFFLVSHSAKVHQLNKPFSTALLFIPLSLPLPPPFFLTFQRRIKSLCYSAHQWTLAQPGGAPGPGQGRLCGLHPNSERWWQGSQSQPSNGPCVWVWFITKTCLESKRKEEKGTGFGVIESVLLKDWEHYGGRERGFILVSWWHPIHGQICFKRRPVTSDNIFQNKLTLNQTKPIPQLRFPTPAHFYPFLAK